MIRTASERKSSILAFLLPQFHPIPENNTWWGPGFTEWTNVVRGCPLFAGHQQPHLPADLGFYDLRLPESRDLQAQLARNAGVDGFVYYHYWFSGRRLLERPFNEVLESGKPDFPFCLCWVNESWSRNWDGANKNILMPQAYSKEDDEAHIAWLIKAFKDPRYIKREGKPVFLVYRPSDHPSFAQTSRLWKQRVQEAGFPGLHLCCVQAFLGELKDPAVWGADAAVEFRPNLTDCGAPLTSEDPLDVGCKLHKVWYYDSLVRIANSTPYPTYTYYPTVCPSWDNSVRRKENGVIFKESTPRKYEDWLKATLLREHVRGGTEGFVFVNAWNEWAEGNHLEPCQKWGRAYMEATLRAKEAVRHLYAKAADSSASLRREGGLGGVDLPGEEGGARLKGWAYDMENEEAPGIVALARVRPDGTFEVLRIASSVMDARPDIEKHLLRSDGLFTGWSFDLPVGNVLLTGAESIIAFSEKGGDWFHVANV